MGIRRKRSAADGMLNSNFKFKYIYDNYFTSFGLLTHLGVNNIRAAGVLNKNGLGKCTVIGGKQLQNEWNVTTLNSAHQAKKQCNYD